ncbi:MAG: hypothetical protein JWO83_4739 [Caulobacteraceae bacterium]|nr:hypothetical protein [Caulobacteraceae bacterium]
MEPGIGRGVRLAVVIAGLAWVTVGPSGAQDVGQPPPPPAAPTAPAAAPEPPAPSAPASPATAASVGAPKVAPPAPVNLEALPPPPPEVKAEAPKPKTPPPGPPLPARAPAAVLRVLDKVTAETMAFEAPVGRRVRYKSLVFEVKACVTRGPADPQPQPSVYLVITSDAGVATGAALAPRQVFKGWMFANAPGVSALRHPVYDAWLVACNAAAPAM